MVHSFEILNMFNLHVPSHNIKSEKFLQFAMKFLTFKEKIVLNFFLIFHYTLYENVKPFLPKRTFIRFHFYLLNYIKKK